MFWNTPAKSKKLDIRKSRKNREIRLKNAKGQHRSLDESKASIGKKREQVNLDSSTKVLKGRDIKPRFSPQDLVIHHKI